MSTEKVSQIRPIPVRLHPKFRAKIESECRKNRWSLNTWLVVAAEEKIARDQEKAA